MVEGKWYSLRVKAWRESGTWKSWALDNWKGSLWARPRARLQEGIRSGITSFPPPPHLQLYSMLEIDLFSL